MLLNTAESNGRELDQALGVIGTAVSAEEIVLVKRQFTSGSDFITVCLGSWSLHANDDPHESPEFEFLKPGRLLEKWWNGLASNEVLFIEDPYAEGLPDYTNIVFVPLFLELQLFGFLAALNTRGADFLKSNKDFLVTVGRILELFLAGMNLRKRFDDFMDSMPTPVLVMDVKGIVTGWNKPSEEMTGWKAEQIIGIGDYGQSIPYYGERRPSVSNLILTPTPTGKTVTWSSAGWVIPSTLSRTAPGLRREGRSFGARHQKFTI